MQCLTRIARSSHGSVFWPLVLLLCIGIAVFGTYYRLYSKPATVRTLAANQQQLADLHGRLQRISARVQKDPNQYSSEDFGRLTSEFRGLERRVSRDEQTRGDERLGTVLDAQLRLVRNGSRQVDQLRHIWEPLYTGTAPGFSDLRKQTELEQQAAVLWRELFVACAASDSLELRQLAARQGKLKLAGAAPSR